MCILRNNKPSHQLTRLDMQSAAESKLRQIQETTTDLLQRTTSANDREAEELRAEVNRLAGVGFVLTRLLCLDDVEQAYRLVNGEADADGTTLGLAT